MPIYKFKTLEDAEKALWNFRSDEAHFKKVSELWEFANNLNKIKYPKGIYKFTSIAEANKDRTRWELSHAKTIQLKMASNIVFKEKTIKKNR